MNARMAQWYCAGLEWLTFFEKKVSQEIKKSYGLLDAQSVKHFDIKETITQEIFSQRKSQANQFPSGYPGSIPGPGVFILRSEKPRSVERAGSQQERIKIRPSAK